MLKKFDIDWTYNKYTYWTWIVLLKSYLFYKTRESGIMKVCYNFLRIGFIWWKDFDENMVISAIVLI